MMTGEDVCYRQAEWGREIRVPCPNNHSNTSTCSIVSEEKKPVCRTEGPVFAISRVKGGRGALQVAGGMELSGPPG